MPDTGDWTEAGIAMLGPTECGKSTFLCALKMAILEHDEDWVLFARDVASRQALEKMSGALVNDGELPGTTTVVDTVQWILSGTIPRAERNGRFGAETTVRDHVEITLGLTDSPGELGRSDRVGHTDRDDLIRKLADSGGILFMFDPIREFTHGDAFQKTDSLLTELIGVLSGESGFDGRLPHHLAVCVTKLDDPRVFQTALDLRLLVRDDTSEWGFPQAVDGDDAQRLFYELGKVSRNGNGNAVPRLFERYFRPERINYYATSAVGFMVNQRTRKFTQRDTVNVYKAASGEALVRGPVHPVNVVEPVKWLAGQLTDPPRGTHSTRVFR